MRAFLILDCLKGLFNKFRLVLYCLRMGLQCLKPTEGFYLFISEGAKNLFSLISFNIERHDWLTFSGFVVKLYQHFKGYCLLPSHYLRFCCHLTLSLYFRPLHWVTVVCYIIILINLSLSITWGKLDRANWFPITISLCPDTTLLLLLNSR